MKKSLKIFLGFLTGLIIFLVAGASLLSLGESSKAPYVYGVTFRYTYAQGLLGLDWKNVYSKMFTDLSIKNVRLPVYWEEIEKQKGERDYSAVDYQMQVAAQNNAHVILAIGRRVPGWPECHIPDWAASLPMDEQQQALIAQMTETINRYKNSPALAYWQVENEPFLVRFGQCPSYSIAKYLDQEIALVRQLDPNHPIITTDSGELSTWVLPADRGDIFGSTLYTRVFADSLKRYEHYHIPAIFYRAKKGLVHLFRPEKPIWNIELQGEPWTTKGIPNTSFEEQQITFGPGSLTQNLEFAKQSGFSTFYFWGVEYWYWAAQHGHPEFLKEAKTIFNSTN